MSDWMPIETVPNRHEMPIIERDRIEVFFSKDAYERAIIKKQNKFLYTPDIILYKKNHECDDCNGCKEITIGSVLDGYVTYIVMEGPNLWYSSAPLKCFSHWMPLPAPPTFLGENKR